MIPMGPLSWKMLYPLLPLSSASLYPHVFKNKDDMKVRNKCISVQKLSGIFPEKCYYTFLECQKSNTCFAKYSNILVLFFIINALGVHFAWSFGNSALAK